MLRPSVDLTGNVVEATAVSWHPTPAPAVILGCVVVVRLSRRSSTRLHSTFLAVHPPLPAHSLPPPLCPTRTIPPNTHHHTLRSIIIFLPSTRLSSIPSICKTQTRSHIPLHHPASRTPFRTNRRVLTTCRLRSRVTMSALHRARRLRAKGASRRFTRLSLSAPWTPFCRSYLHPSACPSRKVASPSLILLPSRDQASDSHSAGPRTST